MNTKNTFAKRVLIMIGLAALPAFGQAADAKFLQWVHPVARDPLLQITFPDAKSCQQALAAFADKAGPHGVVQSR